MMWVTVLQGDASQVMIELWQLLRVRRKSQRTFLDWLARTMHRSGQRSYSMKGGCFAWWSATSQNTRLLNIRLHLRSERDGFPKPCFTHLFWHAAAMIHLR